MNVKHPGRVAIVGLAAGLLVDLLFWKQSPGITVPLFVILLLGGLIYLTLAEGLRPPRASWLLVAPILFFAAFISVRQEPFTLFICWLLMLVSLTILAMTWLGGQWLKFSLADYIVRLFTLLGNILSLPFQKLSRKKANAEDGNPAPSTSGQIWWRKVGIPAGVGLVLAVPAVAILGALLSEADPIFKAQMADFLNLFVIPDIGEFVWRVFYVLVFAFIFSGALFSALLRSNHEKLLGADKPIFPNFLSWITSAVVLLAVDLLFAFFVYVQFRYFFGGQANITVSGYTYSEYAVKGFNELVAVAILSLLLFLGLGISTARSEGSGRRVYTGLGVVLVLLVGVMLVSAFQRLGLYEAAYGFTRLRVQTAVFMVWLGVLLAITVFLEITNRLRAFATATLLVALGFGVSLSLLNMDAYIARQNVARTAQGEKLDIPYLVSLSSDAAPALYDFYTGLPGGDALRPEAKGILLCRLMNSKQETPSSDWRSFHFASNYESQLRTRLETDLPESRRLPEDSPVLTVDGKSIDCEYPTSASYD